MKWECGLPKSQANAFNWQRPSDKESHEALERRRAADRARYYKYKERDQTIVREQLKKSATRVNKCVELGAHGGVANALKGR